MGHEIEVKVAVDDVGEVTSRLETLGARLVKQREFEDNRLFDLEGQVLTSQEKLLRVRSKGGRHVVTVKGPVERVLGREHFKIREEVETEVPDADAFVAVLEAAGFRSLWRYQKYRGTYELDGVEVVVDEIPHGCYLELEGDPDAIDAVAAKLGIPRERYVNLSYRDIHEEECARRGVPVGDLLFEDPGPGSESEPGEGS